MERELRRLREQEGLSAISVVLMHSYGYTQHELEVGKIAERLGFTQISLSHQVMQRVKIVNRGSTCCVDSYLNPHSKLSTL